MTNKANNTTCWYCHGQLAWSSDFDYGDIYGEGEGIVTFLTCMNCGAEVQYSRREDETETTEV